MKRFLGLVVFFMIASCTSVDSGFEAPIVSYGGETNMTTTLGEGMHYGLNYIFDSTPDYEIRNQTLTIEDTYFDKNDMEVPVIVTVYYNPQKGKTNYLHKNIGPDYKESRLTPILKGSLAKVIPQYSAQNLNKISRAEAEKTLKRILIVEAGKIYIDVTEVQFTKVGIPKAVAKLATETAVQIGRNELASKKEEEQKNLANAKIAEAKGNYEAGVLNAKTKDILSQPKMLEMMRIENERILAEGYKAHGKSIYGTNNYFGASAPVILKNLK